MQITRSFTCIDLGFPETSVTATGATKERRKGGKQMPQQAVRWDGVGFLKDPAGLMVGLFGLSVPGSLKQLILSLFLLCVALGTWLEC